ncbi:MAG: hypothetical protein M3015_01540, partial [Bacteroidota bacterium]|nr:hypothetical protein [Bacteroidota bacterium]
MENTRVNKMIVVKLIGIIFLTNLSFQKVDGQSWLKKIKDAANKEMNKVTSPKATQGVPSANNHANARDSIMGTKTYNNSNNVNVVKSVPGEELPKEIHIIPNSDSFNFNYESPILFNDKLLGNKGNQFSEFNGNSFKNIYIPDSLYGIPDRNFSEGLDLKPVIYKNEIYIPTLTHRILKYNGTTLTPVV